MIKWRMVRKLVVTVFGFVDRVFNTNTEWLRSWLFFIGDHRPVAILPEPLLPFVTVLRWQASFIIELFCKLLSQLHYAPFIHFQTPWRRGNHTMGLFDNFKKAKVRPAIYWRRYWSHIVCHQLKEDDGGKFLSMGTVLLLETRGSLCWLRGRYHWFVKSLIEKMDNDCDFHWSCGNI